MFWKMATEKRKSVMAKCCACEIPLTDENTGGGLAALDSPEVGEFLVCTKCADFVEDVAKGVISDLADKAHAIAKCDPVYARAFREQIRTQLRYVTKLVALALR